MEDLPKWMYKAIERRQDKAEEHAKTWRGPTEEQLDRWRSQMEAIPEDVWKESAVRGRRLIRIARRQRRMAALALILAVLGCVLVVPAPFAVLTGWLAIRPRGLDRSAGHNMALAAIITGSIVTVLALAGLIARSLLGHG